MRWCGVGSLLSGEDEPRVHWAAEVHKGVLSAEEAPWVESTVVLWVQEMRYGRRRVADSGFRALQSGQLLATFFFFFIWEVNLCWS